MRNLDIKAVLLASLAVFGIDILASMILFGMFAELPVDASEDQIQSAAKALAKNREYLTVALILGTASTVVGGFLIDRLARSLPYYNALAFGVLGILVSLAISSDIPTWALVVGLGLTIPAALLGVYLSKRLRTASGGRSD